MGALFLASKLEESFAKLTNITMVYDHLLRRCQEKPTYPPLDGFSQVSKKIPCRDIDERTRKR